MAISSFVFELSKDEGREAFLPVCCLECNRILRHIFNQKIQTQLLFQSPVISSHWHSLSRSPQEGDDVISYCDRTFPGWSHDVTARNWACIRGQKQGASAAKMHHIKPIDKELVRELGYLIIIKIRRIAFFLKKKNEPPHATFWWRMAWLEWLNIRTPSISILRVVC